MRRGKFLLSAGFVAVLMLFCAVDYSNGQGRGRGGGGGNGGGNGGGSGAGRGAGTGQGGGMGQGQGQGSGSGAGSNTGFGTPTKSKPQSPADRAQHAKTTAHSMSDNELNRYRGLSKKLGTTPEIMRANYEAALIQNPNLKYGQFVSANVVADNLGGRFPNITSSAILAGLAQGDSLGQTLQRLGMTKEQSKIAQRDAEDKIDAAKKRDR